ncbi:MAG: hypothetical protein QGH76_07220 [Phycisphaerales bacterium]|jgi:hypothetical protein|nr:hypothetical protein [Phycisphaerales bacterium]
MQTNASPTRGPLAGLIALNAVLLAILAAVVFMPAAEAQVVNRHRYTAAAAHINGVEAGVVFILDTTTQELVAAAWNHNTKMVEPLGYRGVASDAASALRGR